MNEQSNEQNLYMNENMDLQAVSLGILPESVN